MSRVRAPMRSIGRQRTAPSQSPIPGPQSPIRNRHGISLIEVLISIFVLLFGLMGVAAIFPVASHYVLEGDKRDRSSGLAQIAFEEIKARKLLKPEEWAIPYPGFAFPFVQLGQFTLQPNQGHAFVLDPLGTAVAMPANPPITGFDYFPLNALNSQNPWAALPSAYISLNAINWPVRRLTMDLDPHPLQVTPMSGQTAETAFRLRDDLAMDMPDAGDRPSVQRWAKFDPNSTPANPLDDQLLARQYVGDYSWMATVVPTNNNSLQGMAPLNNIQDGWYEVSAVVFYKRDIVPSTTQGSSPGSERLIAAEFLNRNELAIFDADTSNNHPETVETALDGVKPGNWVAVMGVHQVTGAFLMKWYKVQAVDDEDTPGVSLAGENGTWNVRYMMVQGPDWPASSYTKLGVAILPGIVDVYTRVMKLTNNDGGLASTTVGSLSAADP